MCNLRTGRRRSSPIRWRRPYFIVLAFCVSVACSLLLVSLACAEVPLTVSAPESLVSRSVSTEYEDAATNPVVVYVQCEAETAIATMTLEIGSVVIAKIITGSKETWVSYTFILGAGQKWKVSGKVFHCKSSYSNFTGEGKEGKEGPAGPSGPTGSVGPEGKSGPEGKATVGPTNSFSEQIDGDVGNLEIVGWMLFGAVIGCLVIMIFRSDIRPW